MKCILSSIVALAIVAPAAAHFVYLVPDGNTGTLKAVFSDTLKPDEKVSVEKAAKTKLIMLDAAGKESAVQWALDKPGSFYKIELPGTGPRIVAGISDYGVLQRGDSKPFFLKYYSKAIVGDPTSLQKVKLGDRVPVEIIPHVDGGKIRFQVLVAGKPAVKAEVGVMVPGEENAQNLMTDEKGFTTAFAKAGQYGVHTRHVQTKSGEENGKKYEEIRSYATLVVTLEAAK